MRAARRLRSEIVTRGLVRGSQTASAVLGHMLKRLSPTRWSQTALGSS